MRKEIPYHKDDGLMVRKYGEIWCGMGRPCPGCTSYATSACMGDTRSKALRVKVVSSALDRGDLILQGILEYRDDTATTVHWS